MGGVHHCRGKMLLLESSFLCGGGAVGGQLGERCYVLLLDDNVVREMMHHEKLFLTGRVVAERDKMSCFEMPL